MKLKFFAAAMPLALMLTACDKQEDKFAGFTAVGTDKKTAKFYLDTNTVKRNRSGWVSFNMVRDLTDGYVIQNAETNCDNRFFTLEGVKYRQDGTSQEKFAAETINLVTGEPTIEDVKPVIQSGTTPTAKVSVDALNNKFPMQYSLHFTVPPNHHAYLDQGNEKMYVPFTLDADNNLTEQGFRIDKLAKPSGVYDNEVKATILRGSHDFSFELAQVAIKNYSSPISLAVKYQLCNDITYQCFRPQTFKVELKSPPQTQQYSADKSLKDDVTALVKMACDKAEENRMITGAFDDGKAIELLYGNYDANTKTASWENIDPPNSLGDYEKFTGKTGTVKILESKEFTQDGTVKHALVTSTSVNYPADVLLSSVVFIKKGDKWQTEKEHPYLTITDKNVTATRISAFSEYPDLIVKTDNGENEQYRFNSGLYAPYKVWLTQEFELSGNKFRVEFDSITPVYKDDVGVLQLGDCRRCQAEVGATLYEEINGVWKVVSKQQKIAEIGEQGRTPYNIVIPAQIIKVSSDRLLFLVYDDDNEGFQGEITKWHYLFTFSKNTWNFAGRLATGYDNTGHYEKEDSGKSSSYKGKISVIFSSKEYPDLLVTKSGEEPDENYNPIPAKNSLYVFNGKEYEEKKGAKVPTVKNEKVAVVQDTSAAKSSVMQMIYYAVDNGGVGHESEIQEAKLKIEASPKPKKGNKKAARKINDQALALLNTQDFGGAVAKFVEANRLDASDIEIINNLGFAYLKQKNLESAQQTLIAALTMFPDRAAAWSNLGDVFALSGDERKAVACYANTYRFSKDMAKTHQFMKKMNAAEDVPALKQARDGAMSWAQKVYPELQ